jgi:hypothetical protein
MALEDILNNKLRLTPKKSKSQNNFKNLIKLIKSGTLNRQNPYHRSIISMGIREGYIDNELNILKEA